MNTIKSLNSQYEQVKETLKLLRLTENNITNEQHNRQLSQEEIATRSLTHIADLVSKTDCSDFAFLGDTFLAGNQYVKCCDAIEEYRKKILHDPKDKRAIQTAVKIIKDERTNFDSIKASFEQKYNYLIDSADVLNEAMSDSVERALSATKDNTERLLQEAREIAEREYTVELKMNDPLQKGTELPEDFLIARRAENSVKETILKDIGIKKTYENISVNLRRQGNVIVHSDFEQAAYETIDEFVIAYIIRYIESFPMGTVNVHIFDRNSKYLFKRLYNNFRSDESGEVVKKVIQIHSDLRDLTTLRDIYCNDIFKKTSTERPDLFSIYDSDRTDPFNLIVLRDGYVDSSGYAQAEILDTVNALTRPGDTGHICGFRFLIIDSSSSFENSLSENAKHRVKSVHNNCGLELEYSSGKFSIDNKEVEVLHISQNLDSYVQERSRMIAGAINSMEKNVISLDEVSSQNAGQTAGNILYIPVGKAGEKTVELPFSCKDEDGTVAGQCIGYMAIGQSGSGKSSFFHSVVMNGCIKYSPMDLQFWLLDFKNGGASSKYSNSGIPHIRIIAENNKIDDALCLFQMILDEIDRRSKAFNKNFTDNIIEYNKIAIREGLEYFPRIIIAIDEVQEIFRDDNASVLQKMISSITSRMRFAGIHFVMVAQNLSEGKTYMLKDAFFPSTTGRICFRVAQDIPRDSGFDDDFVQRKQEISELKTGEAYVSYGKGTIQKVKMAFISPEEMSGRYFDEIRAKYPDCDDMKPRVIGSRKRLAITSNIQGLHGTYLDEISGIKAETGTIPAVIGEDVYRMTPLYVNFTQHENSALLLLGSDKIIASSICASIAASLIKCKVKGDLFNADRTKVSDESETWPHPFMHVCQMISNAGGNLKNHRLDEFKDLMKEMYSEYLHRQKEVQKAGDEDPVFEPFFLIVNDLFGIESFRSNVIIENQVMNVSKPSADNQNRFFRDIFDEDPVERINTSEKFEESIQNVLNALVRDGYRYNIHVILAIKGEPSLWRGSRVASDAANAVLFNETEYADEFENSYYLKTMLKNIANDNEEETLAVWSYRKNYSKVRPIIYDMSDPRESEVLERLIKGA